MSSNDRTVMKAFKAYDIRGIYGTEVTKDLAKRMGSAFGTYCDSGAISVGRDTRISGPELEEAFIDGALNAGCEIDSYGIIPISLLSFETLKNRRRAAGYISASHNLPEYNGIRFRTGEGYGLLYKNTSIIDAYKSGKFNSGKGQIKQKDPYDALRNYEEYVSNLLHLKEGIKVVLDMGNGAACIMDKLYKDLVSRQLCNVG
jgi:phosphomannomutase